MLLERCLEKNSAQRYHTIADARVDLQKAMADPAGFSASAARQAKRFQFHGAGRQRSSQSSPLLSAPPCGACRRSAICRSCGSVTYSRRTTSLPTPVIRSSLFLPTPRRWRMSPPIGCSCDRRIGLRHRRFPALKDHRRRRSFRPTGSSWGISISRRGNFAESLLQEIPVTLAKVTNVFGARWNIDDTIVYGADTGVWKISARGGAPEAVVRITGGERMHSPQLLPGGESVLFTLRPSTGSVPWRQAQIVVQLLRTGERKIIRAGRDARCCRPATSLMLADDTLFAMPFDVNRLEALDAPIPVAEGLRFATSLPGSTGTANYDISSNGVLVYAQGSASATVRRQLVAVVTETPRRSSPKCTITGGLESLRTARIAVEVDDDAGAQLFIVNVKAGTATPLNTGGSNVYCCSWTSTDALSSIAMIAKTVTDCFDSHLMAATRLNCCTERPRTSREGVLVFASGEQTGRRSILTIRIGESNAMPFLVTPALEHMPAFSPDGRWIAYASNESGRSEIYIGLSAER